MLCLLKYLTVGFSYYCDKFKTVAEEKKKVSATKLFEYFVPKKKEREKERNRRTLVGSWKSMVVWRLFNFVKASFPFVFLFFFFSFLLFFFFFFVLFTIASCLRLSHRTTSAVSIWKCLLTLVNVTVLLYRFFLAL